MASSRQIRKRIRYVLLTFWMIVLAWLFYSMQARGFDPAILENNTTVQVETSDGGISFRSLPDTASVGLILYPGALVDPQAYAPLARAIADAGYRVVIVKVPFRIDAFDWQWDAVVERTEAVRSKDTERTGWVVGGHSRGGKMAARLVSERADQFEGLLLVGTSHPRRDNLSQLSLDVTKVFASEDGLASVAEIEAFAHNLPSSTRFVRVEGGNHRQFGYYGWQPGDGRATIDRETQQRKTVEAALAQLKRVEQTASRRTNRSR